LLENHAAFHGSPDLPASGAAPLRGIVLSGGSPRADDGRVDKMTRHVLPAEQAPFVPIAAGLPRLSPFPHDPV
jgi:hypothetical protein